MRLPVELIVFLAVVLGAARRGRLGCGPSLASPPGVVLGLRAVFRLLDLGFLEALNRPFDPLIDWQLRRLAGRDRPRLGRGRAGAVLLVAGRRGSSLALLVLLPLVVAAGHPRRGAAPRARRVRVVAVLAVAVAGARPAGRAHGAGAGRVRRRRRPTSTARCAGSRRAARPAGVRPRPPRPTRCATSRPPTCSPGCAARTCWSCSSRATAGSRVEDPTSPRRRRPSSTTGTRQLEPTPASPPAAPSSPPRPSARSAGWRTRRSSPGCGSTASSATTHLVTSPRLTLTASSRAPAGARSPPSRPTTGTGRRARSTASTSVYDSRNVGYRGRGSATRPCPTSTPSTPSTASSSRPRDRRPVMAEIDLITSHAPWSRTPRMIAAGRRSATARSSTGMPEHAAVGDRHLARPDRVRAAYGHSIEYSLSALVVVRDDLRRRRHGRGGARRPPAGDDRLRRPDAGHDVPVTVIARDPAVLDPIAGWGWDRRAPARPDAPVWRMDAFRDQFLAAYGPDGHTGASAGARVEPCSPAVVSPGRRLRWPRTRSR